MVQGPGSSVQGSRVLKAVILTVMATMVVPPAGAWWLNSRRIATTQARVDTVVMEVGARALTGVVFGPGRLPDPGPANTTPAHDEWLAAAVAAPDAFGSGTPTDAWGRCFLMNNRWLLSAGPNGVIDTPLDSPMLRGDDVGGRR